MNDFFTELDSDLRDGGMAQARLRGSTAKTTKPSHDARKARPTPPAAMHKKREPQGKTQQGHRNAPISGHIAEARSQMMQSWAVVIVFKTDETTRMLLGHLKIETRGFAHPDEVREVHKAVIKRARASYEDTIKDVPDIEEKDLVKIIRQDLEIFLTQRLGQNPVVIPIIVCV